jgi:hypothetical protein
MVVVLSLLYLKYGGIDWIQGAFYGIGAGVALNANPRPSTSVAEFGSAQRGSNVAEFLAAAEQSC